MVAAGIGQALAYEGVIGVSVYGGLVKGLTDGALSLVVAGGAVGKGVRGAVMDSSIVSAVPDHIGKIADLGAEVRVRLSPAEFRPGRARPPVARLLSASSRRASRRPTADVRALSVG